MMSIKELLTYKISVTHATVAVFVWVMTAIMAQFDLYQPIPWENIALVLVVIMVVLLSKQLDQQQQKLVTLDKNRVRVTSELDAVMLKVGALLEQYQKFYKSLREEPPTEDAEGTGELPKIVTDDREEEEAKEW